MPTIGSTPYFGARRMKSKTPEVLLISVNASFFIPQRCASASRFSMLRVPYLRLKYEWQLRYMMLLQDQRLFVIPSRVFILQGRIRNPLLYRAGILFCMAGSEILCYIVQDFQSCTAGRIVKQSIALFV